MYPVLYSNSETTFTARGIGTLSDCVSCIVSEELNGGYTVELKYPKNGIHQEDLLVRNIIVVQPNRTQEREAFRIYKVDRRLKDYITVYANQLSYDLSGYIAYGNSGYVNDDSLNLRDNPSTSATKIKVMSRNDAFKVLAEQTADGINWIQIQLYEDGTVGWCDSWYTYLYNDTASSLAEALSLLNMCSGGFTISTNKSSNISFKMDAPASVRSWFGGKEGSLIDIYGGEWKYNFFTCSLLSLRGADKGLRVSYGVNMADYQRQNEDNRYSHVMAYYFKDESGTLTKVESQEVAVPNVNNVHRVLMLDVTNNYQSGVPTSSELTTYATNYATTYRAKLAGDSQTITVTPEILNTQEISLGDTVHVSYEEEIITTRVVKTIWNALADKYDSVVLGTKKTSIAETIKSLTPSTSGNETTNIIVDDALSSTSTNPVQNKVIYSALDGKVPTSRTVNGKALSSNITLTASDVGAMSEQYVQAFVNADSLNLRQTAGTGTIIANMPGGAVLQIMGETTVSGVKWYHVKYIAGNLTGYCQASSVTTPNLCAGLTYTVISTF